jgi:hypothetical protein
MWPVSSRPGSWGAPPGPFVYKHLGSLATIGRKAVADFGWVRLSGALAWWLWGAVHIAFLVGLRNRISAMWDWFWAYLTFRSGTRLITGSENLPEERTLTQKPAQALKPEAPQFSIGSNLGYLIKRKALLS